KKKGKKGVVEENIVSVPDPDPEAESGWGFGSKRDKKKGKKDTTEDKAAEEPPIVVVGGDPGPEPTNAFDWGFSGKKEKKKGKKGVEEENVAESAIVEVPENDGAADLGWSGLGAGKKEKKKTKKELAEEEKAKESAAAFVPEAEAESDLGWGSFGTKKEKKKGKKVIEEVAELNDDDIIAVVTDPDPEPVTTSGWGGFGSKKDTKKSKGGVVKDAWDDTDVIKVPDVQPVVEDSFNAGWGATTKKGKKDKKATTTTVKEDPITVVDTTAAAEAGAVDDDWMNWGNSDKKKDVKKGKKGAAEAKKDEGLPPPPTPPVPEVPEKSCFDIWGSSKKDKKGKKGKFVDPEPAVVEVPEFSADTKAEPEGDDWGTFALSPKDKKKKEKEKKEKEKGEKERKEAEELEKQEKEEQEKEEQERKDKEAKEKEKVKPGKKGKTSTTTTASKTKDLLADSIPDPPPAVEGDSWGGIWGSSKKDSKKKSGKDSAFAVPPLAPTPPAQGLTPPPEDDLDDLLNDTWATSATVTAKGKKDAKKSSKEDESKASKSLSKDKIEDDKKKPEESAAKAAKSFWGGMTSTTPTSKAKTAKEKKKEEEEAKAKKELDALDLDAELDLDEIVDIIEEEPAPPPKKGSKSKATDSKLTKSSSKDDKAAKSSVNDKKVKAAAEIDALIDLDEPEANDSKNQTADATKSKEDDKKADAWSFWGSSKKTSGKKGDEPKKEINKQESTNQNDALAFLENEPEDSFLADEPKQSQSTKSPKAAMSTSKTPGKLSVAQKVKALEEEKKKALEPPAPPPIPEPEPLAKKASATSKTKAATTSKFASPTATTRRKDSSPPPTEAKKNSKDSVPGSFPAEANDEENLIDMLASTPIEKKSTKKGTKPIKKEKVSTKDIMDVDVIDVPAAPPTPPAEPEPPKPAKKERARVVRDEGASSWGFWGAAPKKDVKKATKAKDDAEVSSSKKTATPALVRSKSTKTPKEKDKDTEKSSGSDGKEKKAETRPSKSRGSSFGFFGGPPPVRAKTVRRTSTSAASKTTSRRESMDIDAFGLPSPPPEDAPATSGKAAKVMGTTSGKSATKTSSKGKQKAAVVPDPYPIDDDDMVMVNGLEDPVINAPIPKTSGKSGKSKSTRNKPADAGDDIVMVDGPSQEDPEPLAFVETPKAPQLRRSATSAKKPNNGKLMGLFGGFGKTRRNSETLERPKTKTMVTDDEGLSPRKRTVHSREDPAKRIRRDDRKVRRSEKPDRDNEVFITDALNEGGPTTEYEDAGTHRKERRSKRDAGDSDAYVYPRRDDGEKVGDGSRRAKTSERRSKREDGEDSRRQEEKRSRRTDKEERYAKEPEDQPRHSSSRPLKTDRRQSYMDPPRSSERPKAHRSRTEQSSSKRRSMAANDDYFNPRNGIPEEGKNAPYMHGANDHTSSWVKSQLSDPADPPLVEGTVIEPTPELGGKGGYEKEDDEEARRAARKARRQSRYGPDGDPGDEDRERRRRRREGDGRGPAVDARPSLGAAGKRGSWLKKGGQGGKGGGEEGKIPSTGKSSNSSSSSRAAAGGCESLRVLGFVGSVVVGLVVESEDCVALDIVDIPAANQIMNDDLQAAEDGLANGSSSFHKFGKGMVAFLRATLGFEPEVMREASDRLAEAETTASADQKKAQRDSHTHRSAIYPPGSEYALCHAESQLMSAVVSVLNESLTESIRGFYKLRKAFVTLDAILDAENRYMRGYSRRSLDSQRSTESLRSNRSARSTKGGPATFGDEPAMPTKQERSLLDNVRQNEAVAAAGRTGKTEQQKPINDDSDEDEFYDADDIATETETYTGHLEIDGMTKDLSEASLNGPNSRSESPDLPPPRSLPTNHQIMDHDPDSDVFSNPIDVFIHSGANLCFGLLLVMISMIPPAFNKLLFIIGFHGDRDRGLLLLWQASKFHNINGAMAGLCVLGFYHAIVGFADILPDPSDNKTAQSAAQQEIQGYPRERCEALLQDMRTRHPKSQLWRLEEARMEAMNRRLDTAISLLEESSKHKSPLKQVEALTMFEKSLNAMYIHDYALCAESFLKCVKLNNWSHALYYYIAGAAYVELYRQCTIASDNGKRKKEYAEKATEYLQLAPKHAGKKKFMARQLPFDVFVTRKIQKWEARAKEWNVPFIDAVGVSPLEEMIFFWNGFKRMNPSQLGRSLENLKWSDQSDANSRFWQKEEKDEHAVLAVLRGATLRNLGRWDGAVKVLKEGVLNMEKAELKGGLRDDWTMPCAHYEMGVISWMRRKEGGKGEEEWVKESEGWIEKAAKWESYELDARVGLKVATAQDTLKKYWVGRKA
ncbi:MAG: hypothetical protein Q9218_005350, partial [Villophora microphyllina]